MNLPTCPNHLAGSCERSSVIVSKETDTAFVLYCKTCSSYNVWPKERDEKLGRYTAWLQHKAQIERQVREESMRRVYSFGKE